MIEATHLSSNDLIAIQSEIPGVQDSAGVSSPGRDSTDLLHPCPETAAESTSAHTPTVLLVEDDEATRLAMMSWLVAEGFSVLAAANGHEAAGHLERPLEPIDVVVLDVGLPDVDGVVLCGRIREMYPEMPVVVCTGAASPVDVARLVGLGATRYLRKPVNPDELLSVVEAALR
jgi:CheY-like chemotaxis protein